VTTDIGIADCRGAIALIVRLTAHIVAHRLPRTSAGAADGGRMPPPSVQEQSLIVIIIVMIVCRGAQ